MTTDLLPLFRWTGGKRKEIPKFRDFFPSFVKEEQEYTYVEPFAGAAAVYWNLNNINGRNVLNDYDWDVVNFYRNLKAQDTDFLEAVAEASAFYDVPDKNNDVNHKLQEANYYFWRNKDRDNGLENLTDAERAARFWIVNQLAFSGMRRFNRAGEFNVPYGHYKTLNCSSLTGKDHVALINKTELFAGDYRGVVEANDSENTFIFIDPPYTRVMKKYSSDNEFGDDKQRELAGVLKSLKKASFMVVIDKSDLTSELYKDHIVHTYSLQYGVNIRNRFATNVEHIVATNY